MDFTPYQLNIAGRLMDLSRPQVMAIINITPDSFYSGSRLSSDKEVLLSVEKALTDGASLIDVGAYSTRPSAEPITDEEEKERLKLPLQAIRSHFPEAIVSLDTFRAEVARWAVEEMGVKIINDISGGTLDSEMFATVADLQVPYIMMHMRGTPQTMQQLTDYDNLLAELLSFFQKRTAELVQMGAKDIVIDPGFGFAKTLDQNYELLAKMHYLKELGFPILLGVSRKSMLYRLLDITPEEALNATTVVNTLGLLHGANILRVHDVKEAVESVKIFNRYQQFK